MNFIKKLFFKQKSNPTLKLDQNQKNLLVFLRDGFLGSIKLTKTLFLIQSEANKKKLSENFAYNFYRWDYGPFDNQIYRDLENLHKMGLINIDFNNLEKRYSLTLLGQSQLDKVDIEISSDLKNIIKKWTKKSSLMTKESLITYIYKKARVFDYEMGDKMNYASELD